MKFLIFTFVVGSILQTRVWASGSSVRGGGDLCEDQIKIIRDDIASWINKGGPKDLVLPNGVSSISYSKRMLEKIGTTKVLCIGKSNEGYPVQVFGTPKVCRWDIGFLTNDTITCDRDSFMTLTESQQYVLVHHEYAGLAGIEVPNKSDSNYSVSNQLSDFLVDQIVKRLAIKGQEKETQSGYFINEATRAVFLAVETPILNTKFSDCSVQLGIPHVNGIRRYLALKSKDSKRAFMLYTGLYNYEPNKFEVIKPTASGKPLELKITNDSYASSLMIYLDPTEKEIVSIDIRNSHLVSQNIGTIANPRYQTSWISESWPLCTAVKK